MSRSAGKKPQPAAALKGAAIAPPKSERPPRSGAVARRAATKDDVAAQSGEGHWQDTLLDGTHVLIRPIQKTDTELERDFITHLSPGTRRIRILGQMKEPSDELLRCLTDIDYKHDMAFVALVHRDGETQEVGVSRFGTSIDGKSCECAVTVSDAWRHRGLATALMRHLVDYARARGIRKMVSFDSTQNVEMRELAQFLGFERKPDPRDATRVVHTLKL